MADDETLKASKAKQTVFNPTKKPQDSTPTHEYFTAHQCKLSPEKINAYLIKCGRLRKCLLDLTSVNMGDIRAKNIYRSYSALCAEKYRQYTYYPFSIHAFCKLRIWLEFFVIISLLVSNMVFALYVSKTNPSEEDRLMDTVFFICEGIYVTHIIINFFTGYVIGNTHQYVILKLKKISFHYLTTWFILDFSSTFHSIILFITHISNMGAGLVYWYLLLEAMKLFRIPVLFKYLNNILAVKRFGIFEKTFIQIVVIVLSYLFWNIYFQFAFEYMKEGSYTPTTPNNCSWITLAKLWHVRSRLRFAYTLDRAVGMLRKNSNMNLVEKRGCFENYFIGAWIIAKLLVYHSACKYIVCLFGKESAKAKYFIMTQQVTTLMNQKKYPPRIKEKILKFYAIRFQSHYFAESKMLSCVTGQLREDIIMHTGRQLVRELVFLKQLPRSLLLQIGLKLKLVIFIAGDIIYKIHTVADCMYFIDKGTIAVYSESGKEICHREDGDYFGDVALTLKHSIRTSSAVAVTNCELFRLDKEDFNNSIGCYPTVYENIKKAAITRYEKICVLDEHHKAELKMADDHYRRGSIDLGPEGEIGTEKRQ